MNFFTAPRALVIFLSGGALVAAGACGYPTFGFDPIGTSTTGMVITGASGTGGAGGAGGAATTGTGGDATTSSATSTASASSSGTGCMTTGASTCTPTCGCTAAQKCAVTDEKVGTTTCITAGPGLRWSKCNTNKDCDAKTWCDHVLHVCKPICDGTGQCPTNAQCIPPQQIDGKTDVTDLTVCTAHCDPVTASPCGGNTTCFYDFNAVEFDCSTTLNLAENVTCTASNTCAIGLVCAGQPGAELCKQWCTPIDMNIPNGSCPVARPYCDPVAVNVTYEGTSYGICNPP